MLLTIDIGNTNIAFGLHDGIKWINHWRLFTNLEKTADEYSVLFKSLIAGINIDASQVKGIVFSSVVPELTDTIGRMCSSVFGFEPLIIGPFLDLGIEIDIDNPAEIGPDLIANAAAGYSKYKDNCVVVDFGTALTFTSVVKPGKIIGVTISPGLQSAMEALSANTARLPHVRFVPPPAVIGKNTINSIQSGILNGYTGLVEHIIREICKEIGGDVKIIATGGLSGIMADLCSCFNNVDPWLTLDGLRILHNRITQAKR